MRPVLALPLVLIATGCVHAVVHRLDERPRPERSPDTVEVFLSAPDTSFAVIAVVESRSDAIYEGFDDLRERLVTEAAKLGGDAIILGSEDTQHSVLITATAQIHTTMKKLAAEVIVFTRSLRSG
jgi:hypothetical protein